MNHVFQPYFGKSIRVYIDDFYIYSMSALHLAKVDEVLSRLAQLGGQLNMAKFHIAEKQVAWLGHVVSESRIQADPSKVNALLALSSPTTVKELTLFIHILPLVSFTFVPLTLNFGKSPSPTLF